MEHILVVDDDSDFRHILRMLLEDRGYTIQEAADGQSGLTCMQEQRFPCVVLLDRRMPRMSGIEMLTAVFREPDLFHHQRIILMSTSRKTLSGEIVQGILAHDVRLVEKPFEVSALETLIATLYQAIRPS